MKQTMKMIWMVWCLLVSVTTSYAQSNVVAQNLDKQEIHESFPLADGGTVSVVNTSGFIRVTSWTESRVELHAVKRARHDADWQQVAIEINARPNQLDIRTVYPRDRSNSTSVDYELKVPRTAVLNNLNSTNGEVTITGPVARATARSTSGNVAATDITGDASLSSTSGNVRAEHIGGRVNASATSGSVVIRQVGGDVNAAAVSDNVTVQDVRGRVTAHSISGNVTLRQIDEGARVRSISGNLLLAQTKGRLEADTVSGSITLQDVDAHELRLKSLSSNVRYQGQLYADGTYELQSHSGNIELLIPADSTFNLSAQTFSGSLNTEFPLQLSSGTLGGRGAIRGLVGQGGAQVTATTFSGNVHLKKLPLAPK